MHMDAFKKITNWILENLGTPALMQSYVQVEGDGWEKVRGLAHDTSLELVRDSVVGLQQSISSNGRPGMGWFGPSGCYIGRAVQILEEACAVGPGRQALRNILESTFVLSSTKNNDYSPLNIMLLGKFGVLTRMADKAVRIWNLSRTRETTRQVSDETVINTAMDLVNYSIYLEMLGLKLWLPDATSESEFFQFLLPPGSDLFGILGLYERYFSDRDFDASQIPSYLNTRFTPIATQAEE
jgi:hypothetical protein